MEGIDGEIDAEGLADRELMIDQHVLPFFAELIVRCLAKRLDPLENIYISANVRAFFTGALQMAVKQNYNEDLSHNDAEAMLGVYKDSYRYEMSELISGNANVLRDSLYGRGITKPAAIMEEFCTAVAGVFEIFARRGPQLAESVVSG